MKTPTDPGSTEHGPRESEAGIEDSETAVLVADDQGRYVDCNSRACSLLGYSREEILALSVWDLTPEGNEIEGLQMWQEFIGVGIQAGIYRLLPKSGPPIEVEYRAVANASPGRHVSRVRAIDQDRTLFPR